MSLAHSRVIEIDIIFISTKNKIYFFPCTGVFPLPNVKLTWGKFDLFADKMTAEVNPNSECYEVKIFTTL